VLCVAHYCRLWRRLECRAQLQSRDQRPRIEDRGRGKGKGRQPIENTFVAGETATTISSWAVSANSRHFPRKMATAPCNPSNPSNSSNSQCQSSRSWEFSAQAGSLSRLYHHRLLLLLSSFYNCRCKLLSHACCCLAVVSAAVAIRNCCCRRAMAKSHCQGPELRPKPIALPPRSPRTRQPRRGIRRPATSTTARRRASC